MHDENDATIFEAAWDELRDFYDSLQRDAERSLG